MKIIGKFTFSLLSFFIQVSIVFTQVPGSSNDGRIEKVKLERLPHADLGNGYYRNPVMVGPGSDNTVVRVDKDFYMMAGGGGWPDQLVWHSRDLINWQPLTRALKVYDGGTWASEITYFNGKYYIYTTQMDPRRGNTSTLNSSQRSLLGVPFKDQGDKAWKNVVMWADNPGGPWSDPINIGVYGLFDPGHIVDQKGNRYLYFNKGMMIRLAPDGLSVTGDLSVVYNGWDYPKNWVIECKCLEAPKLTYHDGYFFMSSAQGGTSGPSTAHMGIIARSSSVEGPWENSPYNPIVHTNSRDEKWWRQGHGTLIDDSNGNWWYFFTGYENGYDFYGKQTLLLPVEWTSDKWPRIVPGVTLTDSIKKPAGQNIGHGMPLSDDFSTAELGIQWTWDRSVNPKESFKCGNGLLTMAAKGTIPGDRAIQPTDAAQLSIMPVNHSYQVEVEVTIPAGAEGGIMITGRNSGWATAGVRKDQAFATWAGVANYLKWDGQHIFIRIKNDRSDVSCYYSSDGKSWKMFDNASAVAGVNRVSLYAAGEGEVQFKNFKYRGLDQ